MGQLTEEQVVAIVDAERVAACVSIAAILLVLLTFVTQKYLRNLSNTLIVYASFANVMANVGCLIGYFGILAGPESPLCQFQAFLFEMFMQSDPYWSLAMAINVYLVFIRGYDVASLRRLFWVYCTLCYGVPFVLALVCLLVRDPAKGSIYGNATLWCWISNTWAPIRIYGYYAPIWIVVCLTFLIYTRVGYSIFQTRKQLQAMGGPRSPVLSTSSDQESGPFTGVRLTEVEVVHNRLSVKGVINPPPMRIVMPVEKSDGKHRYSISITTRPGPQGAAPLPQKSSSRARPPNSMDTVKWAYLKCAVLFGISILITWVPASANRIYGLMYPNDPSFALNVASAVLLPLQGLWNTIIYFTTSWTICKMAWADWRASQAARSTADSPIAAVRDTAVKVKDIMCRVGLRKSRDSESAVEMLDILPRHPSSLDRKERAYISIPVYSTSKRVVTT